jgi:hypothetical protein
MEFTNRLPFIIARRPNRNHRLQVLHYCSRMRCLGNHILIPKQRVGFLSVYNFQFPYPWKPCPVISWCPGIRPSVASCLLIRFLETAHMSQYKTESMPTKDRKTADQCKMRNNRVDQCFSIAGPRSHKS